MGLLCLPIHVWDRELDARILLATKVASMGHDVIIGHEYNISGIYKNIPNLFYLHNEGQLIVIDQKIGGCQLNKMAGALHLY